MTLDLRVMSLSPMLGIEITLNTHTHTHTHTLIPHKRALPSRLNCLPMAPPPNINILGVRISTYEFAAGGGTQACGP